MDLVRGHNEDIEEYDEPFSETNLTNDEPNLACEQQIIKCQLQNDRLLGSTAKALRTKYGDDITNRAISRLKQRRKRGKCSVKAENEKYLKLFKPVIEYYFKKQSVNGL